MLTLDGETALDLERDNERLRTLLHRALPIVAERAAGGRPVKKQDDARSVRDAIRAALGRPQ